MMAIYKFFLLTWFLACQFDGFSQDCPDSCEIFMPNTLTPDCCEYGCEFLQIVSNCTFSKFSLQFFDRFGELRFSSEDPKFKFDSGDYPDGTYVWTLKATYCNGKKIDDQGHILIIR